MFSTSVTKLTTQLTRLTVNRSGFASYGWMTTRVSSVPTNWYGATRGFARDGKKHGSKVSQGKFFCHVVAILWIHCNFLLFEILQFFVVGILH